MIEVSLTQVKAALSEYVNRAAYGNERVIITSRGRPKAVLLSIEELERLEAPLSVLDSTPTIEVPPTPLPPLETRTDHTGLLALLQTPPEDDKEPEWWAEFEKELAENRLTFRETMAE